MRDIDDVYVSPPQGQFLVANLDVRHLAVLMFERFAEIRHPDNISLDEAADEIKKRSPETYRAMIDQAHVACEYFAQCMNNATPERKQ
jgi:hypothetical protein